ncbi:tRNA (adenosine(37)-N6)-threonylcarbamoyltransferase complex ATPase subunit type 1 TsaE [Lactococcus kimchii]|uniref:tRNA (adenosine(37)-N6)-threonylcarbamoyltransferase complex ATPase subunit type 1 TsaE n=1 Tax=Lactococcus sp. S-13 TaxID=2507158 RepID=UPI0016810CCE|nr:tRNA (adenosine(37)-N6)-threonylcarbamoyltransferase complex ATPase subunit type 1 TsaE [Lactococcus sp. S-13]
MKFNEEEMLKFAEKLGRQLEAQDVIVLTGELGAGKTTFTKGLALGLDIHQMVKSPTYTIVRSLENGRLPLYHMDVYRIGDDPDSFDLDDYLFGEGVSVIEWGEMLGADLPEHYLEVIFDKYSPDLVDDNEREIILKAHGQRYEQLIQSLA